MSLQNKQFFQLIYKAPATAYGAFNDLKPIEGINTKKELTNKSIISYDRYTGNNFNRFQHSKYKDSIEPLDKS